MIHCNEDQVQALVLTSDLTNSTEDTRETRACHVSRVQVISARDGVRQHSPHTLTVHLDEAVLEAHVGGGHGEDGQVRVDRQIVADELVSCLPDHVPGVSE